MPAKSSSLCRQGWPENTNGFEIDFLKVAGHPAHSAARLRVENE